MGESERTKVRSTYWERGGLERGTEGSVIEGSSLCWSTQ